MSSGITFVTALYDIGRVGRSMSEYKAWLLETLTRIHDPFVVFLDDRLASFAADIETARRDVGPVKIVLTPLEAIPMWRYRDRVAEIQRNPVWRSRLPHPADITNTLPEYCLVQYSKFGWIESVIHEDYFGTGRVAWMDAGFCRFFPEGVSGFACCGAAGGSAFVVQSDAQDSLATLRDLHESEYIGTNQRILQGGLWFSDASSFLEVKREVLRVWDEDMMAVGRLDNEQIALAIAAKRRPELFRFVWSQGGMTALFSAAFNPVEQKPRPTVVTCYYRVPSKASHERYMEWIANFMAQEFSVVVYGDHDSLPDLMAKWPPSPTRIYQFLPMEEFIVAGWDWSKDAARDHERNHSVELYQIWNEKIFMVERAIGMNPYGSAAYMWVDIGCFRESGRTFAGFPEDRRLPRDRVLFLEVEPFTAAERRDVAKIDERFRFVNRIGGTMFGGGKEPLLRFANLYMDLLTEAKREGVFAGKDQSLYAFAILREPSLFWTVPTDRSCAYDAWFYLHPYLSSPSAAATATEKSQHDSMPRKGHYERRTVALVGPGIMPIPPRGWGAVEILVWNMAEELKRRGWVVHILNSSDMVLVESEIRRIRPDFVHIQYDDYADLAGRIAGCVGAVAITSHYGYLEQRGKWGYYEQVFRRCIGIPAPNVYHFALSPGIADVYKAWGVPEAKVRVLHNGADASLFRYTDKPLWGDRSICVGKVEVRKAQYVVGQIPSVYIVGNRGDASFDYGHPRYLGEWAKEELYDRLTDYGNLVLLSDGEADPLVVKEALVAGLGVVVSDVAAANLDRSLPFISVIPMDRVRDVGFVAGVLETNRKYSVEHRAEIRKYAEQFHWSAVIDTYCEEIQKIC